MLYVVSHQLQHKRNGRWSDLNKFESELRAFWLDHGVPLSPKQIPNITILKCWKKNYLLQTLYQQGRHEAVAESLCGSKIVPGR